MFARTHPFFSTRVRIVSFFPHISSLTWAPKQHPRSNWEHFKPSSNSHAFPRNGHNEVTDTQTQIPLWLWQWTLNTVQTWLHHFIINYGDPLMQTAMKNNNIQSKVWREKVKNTQGLCSSRTSTFYELCRSWGITSHTGRWWIVSRPTSHSHTTSWPFREHARCTLGMPFFMHAIVCFDVYTCV